MNKPIDQFINELFSNFNPKQRKVLSDRFGFRTGHRVTLQAIGDELGITRERVRQIEEQSMKKIAPRVQEGAASLIEGATAHLASVGGVRREDAFMAEMKQSKFKNAPVKYLENKLRFLFVVAGAPLLSKEDDDMHAYWYTNDGAQKKFVDFVKDTAHMFRTSDKNVLLAKKSYLGELKDPSAMHFLSISKQFGVNMFGDVGLVSWPEILPKTIRDKSYLVLKKQGKPLHFEAIARYITTMGIDKKSAHVQTVHNELIKDDRFVLVGRGMYGLREHGYEPGTVREVMVRLLKQHGPMHPKEVVRLVNAQRFLKENTILIGLQNRRVFKRLDDGRYHVKEA